MGALFIGAAALVLAAGASLMAFSGPDASVLESAAGPAEASPAGAGERSDEPKLAVSTPAPDRAIAPVQANDVAPATTTAPSGTASRVATAGPTKPAQPLMANPLVEQTTLQAPSLASSYIAQEPSSLAMELSRQAKLFPAPDATAAIGEPAKFEDVVAVADSDQDVAQLEEEQKSENREILSDIRQENGTAFNSPVLREARVNQHVNMRAGPSDDAKVLMVVPTDAKIQAATNCNWCEVAYEGKHGFIWKSFIRR